MTNPTTPLPVQEPAGAVEAIMALADAYAEAAQRGEDAMSIARKCAALRSALASLQPVTQAKPDVSIPGPGMNASGERVDSANVTQAKSEAVAWVNLLPGWDDAARRVFTDRKAAADYHEHCYDLTPVYATPQEAVERQPLTERIALLEAALTEVLEFQSADEGPHIFDWGRWRRIRDNTPPFQRAYPGIGPATQEKQHG